MYRHGKYYPTKLQELSNYIAKFVSPGHRHLLENEYLATQAAKALLPQDQVVDVQIDVVEGLSEPALLIKRFDRSGEDRLHFEEFNQLLGHTAIAKYDGSYEDMATLIRTTNDCLNTDVYRLYKRILAALLLGNTDLHLKNVAMMHTKQGLRLAPVYDEVSAVLYEYKTIALKLANIQDLQLSALKGKHIVNLGQSFGLSSEVIDMAVKELNIRLEAAKQVIVDSTVNFSPLKQQIIKTMESRWNGSFASIGSFLSKKR